MLNFLNVRLNLSQSQNKFRGNWEINSGVKALKISLCIVIGLDFVFCVRLSM